jgi:Phenylpropionate dioxygenase and related ring-hydroxylating dioxygenases, large terminal subunit
MLEPLQSAVGGGPPVAPDDLVMVDDNRFRVHTRAYVDPAIFALEMRRIFSTSWVYLAHTSELPNPGDYKTTHMGLQPVIVSRGDDGVVNVMLNRCVHRGAVVCREKQGSANFFRCPYHGWVYGRDGKLTGVSMRGGDSGYSDDFDQPTGLQIVPRVDSYRGLIFASMAPDGPDLLEHLGRATTVIDGKFDQSPVGEIRLVSQPYVSRYKGNWKFAAENIVDGYHFTFVHAAFIKLQAKYGSTTGDFQVHQGHNQAEERKYRTLGTSFATSHGHGLNIKPNATQVSLVQENFPDYHAQLEAQHGDELPTILGSSTGSIFPNLGIIHHQIRTWRPIAPDVTEVTIYPYEVVGAPDDFNRGWLRSQERFYGPAGHGMPDDVEIFSLNQQGLAADSVDWLILERGLATEKQVDEGDYQGLPSGETPQRGLWRKWKQMMA